MLNIRLRGFAGKILVLSFVEILFVAPDTHRSLR